MLDDTTSKTSPFFLVSWGALEEALILLAATPEQERLVPETVSALRKAQGTGEAPSRLLLRILCATAFLADGAVDPASLPGAGAMI